MPSRASRVGPRHGQGRLRAQGGTQGGIPRWPSTRFPGGSSRFASAAMRAPPCKCVSVATGGYADAPFPFTSSSHARPRRLLLEGSELDLPVEDLGPFRLEKDLPPGHAGLGPRVDHHAVDDVGDLVAVADDLDRVPLARRLLGVELLDLS